MNAILSIFNWHLLLFHKFTNRRQLLPSSVTFYHRCKPVQNANLVSLIAGVSRCETQVAFLGSQCEPVRNANYVHFAYSIVSLREGSMLFPNRLGFRSSNPIGCRLSFHSCYASSEIQKGKRTRRSGSSKRGKSKQKKTQDLKEQMNDAILAEELRWKESTTPEATFTVLHLFLKIN